MKILMINTEFNRSGAAQIAQTLYHILNKNNNIVCYFAYGRGGKANYANTYKFAYQSEVYFQALLTRISGLQGYGSWFSTKRLEKFIIKEKFDLIHLHNLHGYYLNLSFINFLGKLEIPIIWTLHDGWPMTGRCSYLFNCEGWKTGCKKCPDLNRYPKTFNDSSALMWEKKRDYFSLAWNPVIVCPSQWLADRVKESYLKKYDVVVIPNAVDTEIFKSKNKDFIRKKYGIPLEKKIILFVAANLKDERKGVKYFLKSLKHVKLENLMIITVGWEIEFNRFIESGNYKIIQLGYIQDKEEISDIYNIADVFCTSSLDDNFPTTVLEALACGVPVVGFSVGGIPEQVTEDCGIMVKPKDSKSLGEAINKLLNDDEMRKRFGLNCRKRVLQNYTVEKFRDKYIEIYKKY
jgi:glycosyltransferase involved in cell wall biosynthesis